MGLTFALLGVGLSVLTGNGSSTGIATLCIGVLLAAIAVLLARETTSLLIGEAAVPEQVNKIYARADVDPRRRTGHPPAHSAPRTRRAAGRRQDRQSSEDADGEDIAATINDAEARVRQALPSARIIYLEPDIYRPELASAPQNDPGHPDHPAAPTRPVGGPSRDPSPPAQ